MSLASPDLVRVFEHDPDLLDGQGERDGAHLRMRAVARRSCAEPGPWRPQLGDAAPRAHLGLLVLDGLLVRTTQVAGRECSEVAGPGDLLRPWDDEPQGGSVRHARRWSVLAPASFAELDGRFAAALASWPAVTGALVERSMRTCRSLAYQAAVSGVRHATTRLLLTLWHFADRWGRVTPRGVLVPIALTHELLARLTCLRRPTVSRAAGELTRAGELSRSPAGGWLLHGEPPQASPCPAPATEATLAAGCGVGIAA